MDSMSGLLDGQGDGCTILRVVVNGSEYQWTLATRGVPHGSLLGTVLFNIFNNGIEKRIRCSLNKFPDDTNISGVIPSGGWNKVQRDLDKLEKQQGAAPMLVF